MNDPIQDLRAELMAVEPSPAFPAGVRARVEGQRRSWSPLMTSSLACATAAVAVVAGVAYVLNRSAVEVPADGGPVAQVLSPARVPEPAPEPVPTPAANPAVPRLARVSVKPSAVATAEAPAGPFLEVITNQPEMIRRVWAGIDGGVARVGLPGNEFAEIAVVPVTVDAILVPKIGPPSGGGMTPGARRLVVDQSARGDQQ